MINTPGLTKRHCLFTDISSEKRIYTKPPGYVLKLLLSFSIVRKVKSVASGSGMGRQQTGAPPNPCLMSCCNNLEQVEKESGNKYYRQILISRESAFIVAMFFGIYCQIDLVSGEYSILIPFCGDNHCIF